MMRTTLKSVFTHSVGDDVTIQVRRSGLTTPNPPGKSADDQEVSPSCLLLYVGDRRRLRIASQRGISPRVLRGSTPIETVLIYEYPNEARPARSGWMVRPPVVLLITAKQTDGQSTRGEYPFQGRVPVGRTPVSVVLTARVPASDVPLTGGEYTW